MMSDTGLVRESAAEHLDEGDLRGLVETLEHRNEQLLEVMSETGAPGLEAVKESATFGRLSLMLEDANWRKLGATGGETPMSLQQIRDISHACQALIINPMVKRGLEFRSSYVWGRDVQVLPEGASPSMQEIFNNVMGQAELERTIAADGNLFYLCTPRTGEVQRIPLEQIDGAALPPGDSERILYVKRTYTDYSTNLDVRLNDSAIDATGRHIQRWYPTDLLRESPVASIQQVPVQQDQIMVTVPFNRFTGWTWGVPDLVAVVFWVEAYKEYLENCATLTKAYARFAWKVVSSTKKGQQRTASRMAEAPSRDPKTGQYSDVGGAVALGANQDIQALQNARSVDFEAGRPLAAMVAAGLGVPLTALTSDPSEGNRATAETLDEPTKLQMRWYQRIREYIIERIKNALNMVHEPIDWPEISPEPLHRVVQGLDTAGRTGMLYPDEWRKLVRNALNIRTGEDSPPSMEQLPELVKREAEGPAQVAPPSRGDHELRDEGNRGTQASARDSG